MNKTSMNNAIGPYWSLFGRASHINRFSLLRSRSSEIKVYTCLNFDKITTNNAIGTYWDTLSPIKHFNRFSHLASPSSNKTSIYFLETE